MMVMTTCKSCTTHTRIPKTLYMKKYPMELLYNTVLYYNTAKKSFRKLNSSNDTHAN